MGLSQKSIFCSLLNKISMQNETSDDVRKEKKISPETYGNSFKCKKFSSLFFSYELDNSKQNNRNEINLTYLRLTLSKIH